MMGNKQVMVRRFDPPTVFRLIQEEKATGMSLVPTMANALLNAPDRDRYDLSSIKQVHIGGAASSPELVERLETTFHWEVLSGYGVTETAPVASTSRRKGTIKPSGEADRRRRQAMAGWPVPGVEFRGVDVEMNDVPRDMESVGEVVIRGDNVMDGYFKEPEATAAVMSGAWFHSGDMAVWDEEGFIHIVDRKKDIIISGGENISSLEVEKAIFAHPAVVECAVVAAPDEKWGEVPVAIVVLKDGLTLTAAELCAFLEPRIARFKMPRRIEFSGAPLPKTGTGKIVKRALREQYWTWKDKRVQG
jgi:fatty-acyl-CoA synthase